MLSGAEDHAAGGDLWLRGAGRGKMLTTTQRRWEAVWRDWGHRVGDWDAALLQLRRINIAVNQRPRTRRINKKV